MAEDQSLPGSSIQTYHCLCSTLILATPYNLDQLPVRSSSSQDQAIICPLGSHSSSEVEATSKLHNVTADRQPLIVRREDGFEKRTLLRCTRCNLAVGYRVEGDSVNINEKAVFLLLGGLMSTEDMKAGKVPQQPAWGAQVS